MWSKVGITMLIIAFLQLFTLHLAEQFTVISKSLFYYPAGSALFGSFCIALMYIVKERGS
ncbi:hypothetical protein SAMN05421503_0096 [Terribacillus aidingensis]|uniref:Uncharacterized protein n=1 Tax=Terribacillus aidingensis TaxID=586416 RepID=A0A285N302_9BACI|nr:hypothetical protein [Terribacillus aidingensis]SNZ02386.1 hypothetical protein SAMN05421503_0096 [Terribacillus aidingensis]